MQPILREMLIPMASGAALRLAASILLWTSTAAIVAAVAYKFVESGKDRRAPALVKRHVVETFTMAAVIFAQFRLLQLGIGRISTDPTTGLCAVAFGAALVLLATWLHIAAKVRLGTFWSNQIEIQAGHVLVTTGPYAIVRHPMYSSLVLWLSGIGILFLNWAFLVVTWLVFLPMMIWRARAEDRQLERADPIGFLAHARSVHQLVPRFKDPISLLLRLLVIGLLGYSIASRQMHLDRVLLLCVAHFTAGLISEVPKVRFSYINKSFILLLLFGAAQLLPAVHWLYWVVLGFDLYGLKFNCPCMLVYEKYHGCPCLNVVKAALFPRTCSIPAAQDHGDT